MSLHPQPIPPVPEETARVAHAAFPHHNLYLKMRDELGPLFADEDFAALFPKRGQPAETPWRLALVTLMQYVEGLSDRQAADAVRSRIDWKYALSLELTDAGFDSTVLSEFRSRLVVGSAEEKIFETLLNQCRERKLIKARGRQRTDSTHVLARVRAINRLECVGEAVRYALNSLAVVAPEWLEDHSKPEWIERYGRRVEDYRLPTGKEQRQAYAEVIGADGNQILSSILASDAPRWLRELPAVETLRMVWVQQFYLEGDEIHWRMEKEGIPPSSLFISSPYDAQARYARKRTTSWVGYKVHLTESCEQKEPHLITQVETTAGPVDDGSVTTLIHQALKDKGLLPEKHIVDTGYLDAELMVGSRREYQIDLIGPARGDQKWQARAGEGFTASDFKIDWEKKEAICPEEHGSISWSAAVDNRINEVVKIKFS